MKRTIVLSEYQPQQFPRDVLTEATAQRLWRLYARFVLIDYPSPKTNDQWQLTAQGWAGIVPVARDLTLVLQPKVSVTHLLQMVAVAHNLQSVQILPEIVAVATIPAFYEQLAAFLARQVVARCRRGLYRPYQRRSAAIPVVRGRLQIAELLRQPLSLETPCLYHEQAADVEDNQILRWTLHRLLQSDLGRDNEKSTMRHETRLALRALQAGISLRPFHAADCRNRRYTRLNDDYAHLHALCAFFLESSAPSHLPGDTDGTPFVVNMAQLYEQFVAAWLQTHLPSNWQLQIQERHPLSEQLHFAIDLVLYDRAEGKAVAVLDTKYKAPEHGPETTDVAQVVAYAAAKGVAEALLIYPLALHEPLETTVGGVRVRTVSFALEGDLDNNGMQLLKKLDLHEPSSNGPLPNNAPNFMRPVEDGWLEAATEKVTETIIP